MHTTTLSVSAAQPVRRTTTSAQTGVSELRAWDILRRLQGQGRYQVGCHIVDEVCVGFLMTLSRRDAAYVEATYETERHGWPTRSQLEALLANRS
jgi:hypothetical protein